MRAVLDFFDIVISFRHVNCTNLTLFPKVSNPTLVSQYRPIACCNKIYKMKSKVLMKRLQVGIASVVDPAQAGFILGRQLIDTVLLATKLIKGYGRGIMTPRHMIKIDLKKAYNSHKYSFLRSMMIVMGFLERFVAWIMECVLSTSYLVCINGKPCKLFKGKKGIR